PHAQSPCVILDRLVLLHWQREFLDLHSFPTRRSSDLVVARYIPKENRGKAFGLIGSIVAMGEGVGPAIGGMIAHYIHWSYHSTKDRKSTRLNSSHVSISYAVFCLKKKKERRAMHQHHE